MQDGDFIPDAGVATMWILSHDMRIKVHCNRIKAGVLGYFMEGGRRLAASSACTPTHFVTSEGQTSACERMQRRFLSSIPFCREICGTDRRQAGPQTLQYHCRELLSSSSVNYPFVPHVGEGSKTSSHIHAPDGVLKSAKYFSFPFRVVCIFRSSHSLFCGYS